MVHFSRLKASFYWANFPQEYLRVARHESLDVLETVPKVTLHHTHPRSLLKPEERDEFLQEFIALIRCLANGEGDVGFLRCEENPPIHREVSQDIRD